MADTKVSLAGCGAWRLLGASSLVLALAACSGLPTAPTQPVRYDLGMTDIALPVATAAASSVAPVPLVLAEVQAPGLPEGLTSMFYRLNYSDSQQLRAYQNARWSMPPAQMVEQRLRMRLGLERPVLSGKDNVRAVLSDKRSIAQLRVTVDEFSQVFDSASSSRAVLRLSASLIGAGESAGNQLLGQKVFTVDMPSSAADAAGGAQAMARAVDEAAAQISRWLKGYGR
ncbi:MAG: PqiC family protein [Comamonas sp.]|jgi:cholesterol transport system auxiliary component|uniref:ABC-type transport auxiliary lipoprotein family protein n=1 Tax=Comamonas sp. TaxID=34028 RepID=UPI00283EE755|nr:ABC-type transport auxiliary lipoprotein family protein [Comamonas sp.]MDR3066537.1 PqiC family protein [Comamonas sp.]